MKILLQLAIIILFINISVAQETITFNSIDNVVVTADLYVTNDVSSPFIILFHQLNLL